MSKLSDIQTAIMSKHHAFPVMNTKGNFVGLIPRNFLLVLLQERHFYGSNIDGTFATDEQQFTSSKVMQAQVINTQRSPTISRNSQAGFKKLNYKRDDSVHEESRAEIYKYFATYFDVT